MVSDLQEFHVNTKKVDHKTGKPDIINITDEIAKCIRKSDIESGIVNVFISGSTAGLSFIEWEPGLVKTDVPQLLQKLIPEGPDYAHHGTWGDYNGGGHLRSFLINPSLTIPFKNNQLLLGTWQQPILLEFDEKSRTRRVYWR